MKHPNSGFYSFGKSLGNAVITQNKGRYKLYYYVYEKANWLFQKKVSLVFLSWVHKIYFGEPDRFALVHFTDQFCRLHPQKVNGKKVITIHDLNFIHEKSKKQWKIDKRMNKMRGFINECDKVVAISNFVAADILQNLPEAAGKLSVIYNGADRLKVLEGHLPQYQPKTAFLFTIGFIAPKKNFHVLPALLVGNDYELIISGIETLYKDKIVEEAQKHGVLARVKITGPISEEDKAWYYKNCAAFVFPSIAEGFGLPVIEAMHFGKPVFLSTHTSLPEIGADAAFYFESFDPETMQSTFKKGMQEFEAKGMQQKAIDRANQFDWDETARQYLELYDECLDL